MAQDLNLNQRLIVTDTDGVRVTGITSGTYLEISGNLPGYTAGQYPVLKSGGTIHFGVNGQYRAYLEGNDTYFGILNNSSVTTVLLKTSGSSYLNGGNVGIGTTSPIFKLHVEDSISAGDVAMQVRNASTAEGSSASIRLYSSGVGNMPVLISNIPDDTGGTLIFNQRRAGNTYHDTVVFKGNGNVGIGTTSPSAKLDIKSSTNSNAIFVREDTDNSITHNFWIDSSDNGNFWMYANGQSNTVAINSADASWFNGGNVGIGTTNPVYKLSVQGSADDGIILYGVGTTAPRGAIAMDASNNGYLEARTSSGGQNIMLRSSGVSWINGGNVGIGTTSPAVNLHVHTANSGYAYTMYSNSATGSTIGNGSLVGIGNSEDLLLWNYEATPTIFATSGSERMRITPTGNVGIGTTSPGAKLDVSGEVRSNGGFTTQDGSFTRVLNPGNAAYSGNGSVTGAFKITLPMTWSNTMMRMTVKIYDYTDVNKSFTIELGGYNYSPNSTWYNTFAHTTCDSGTDRNFTVRFGHDGSKNCIYIGELTSTWSYPKIAVVDAQFGHSNIESYRWNDGWDIRMETTGFSSVSSTIQNTQATNWKRTGQDVYYGGGSGRVGIGTTAPTEKLDVSGGKFKITSGSNGYGWIYGEDANHSIILRGDRSGTAGNFTSYHQYGGTLANGQGHLFWTGGALANQVLRMQIADDGTIFSGNVGIGTSSPGYSLDVQGNGSIIWATGKTSGGTAIIGCKNSNDGSGHAGADVYLRSSGWGEGFVVVGGHSISAQGGQFNINAGGGSITFNRSGEQMRVTDSGVGIGTTNPGYKLDVSGGAIAIRGNAAGNSLRFDDTGGTSRNAVYVNTDNYLSVGNANYTGLKLYHTTSTTPDVNGLEGNAIQQAYGGTENGTILAEPSAWLAVRIGTTDYAIPMYSLG